MPSSLRLHSLGAPLPQHRDQVISIDQFSALGLSNTLRDVGGDCLTLFEHPVSKRKLLTNDLKSLINNLVGALIRSRPNCQVDDPLLFRF